MALKVTQFGGGGGFVKVAERADFGAQLRALNAQGRALVKQALVDGARAVASDARSRVPVSAGGRVSRKAHYRPGPGELRDTIRVDPGPDSALVAYVLAGYGKLRRRVTGMQSARKSARKRAENVLAARYAAGPQEDLGVYAMVVEYGAPHRGIPAHPYMRPALDAQRFRIRAAVKDAAQQAAERARKVG